MRKTKSAAAILTVAAMSISGSAIAADSNYVGIHGMWTDLKDLDFNVAPGTINTEIDSGTGFGITFGRTFGQIRGEVEYTARMNDVKSHSLNGGEALPGSTGEVKSDAFMVNGYYDIATGGMFIPYIGAGLGMAKVKFDNFGVAPIPDVLNDNKTQFAYQLMAGGDFMVSDKVRLFAEYRYFTTGDVDVTTSSATGSVSNSISYKTNNVLLGARFMF